MYYWVLMLLNCHIQGSSKGRGSRKNRARSVVRCFCRRDEAGFTLTELLVGLVVSLLVIAALTQFFMNFNEIFFRNQSVVRLQQDLRTAGSKLVNDLKMAGFDPLNGSNATFVSAGSASVHMLYDKDGDGDCDTDSEEVVYRRKGDALTRNGKTILTGISDFDISYVLDNGSVVSQTSSPSRVRKVDYRMCKTQENIDYEHCVGNVVVSRNMYSK